ERGTRVARELPRRSVAARGADPRVVDEQRSEAEIRELRRENSVVEEQARGRAARLEQVQHDGRRGIGGGHEVAAQAIAAADVELDRLRPARITLERPGE